MTQLMNPREGNIRLERECFVDLPVDIWTTTTYGETQDYHAIGNAERAGDDGRNGNCSRHCGRDSFLCPLSGRLSRRVVSQRLEFYQLETLLLTLRSREKYGRFLATVTYALLLYD
jgi:hypothetical protein